MGAPQQALLMIGGVWVTWNPNDKGTGITLSNGNLTASHAGLGDAGITVRATLPHNAGKYYFEVYADTVSTGTNTPSVGICDAGYALTKKLSDTGAWGIQSSPAFCFGNGSNTGSGVTYAAGDLYQVAVDLTAGKIWFGKNNTWILSGDPANGTNASWTNVTTSTDMYPAVALTGCTATAHFTSGSFTYSAPSGFSPW